MHDSPSPARRAALGLLLAFALAPSVSAWLSAPTQSALLQSSPQQAPPTQADPQGARASFVRRMSALVEAIEQHHVDPPAREAIVAAGVRSLSLRAELEAAAWEQRLPASATASQLRGFLDALHAEAERSAEAPDIASGFQEGVLGAALGGARLIDAETARVNAQIEGNRYIGVGVVLDFRQGRPVITETYFGGPAHRCGILPGDVVLEVDGVDTEGMDVGRFLDYSRDEVGTELVYAVQQPDGSELRHVRMTRAVVPRESVTGVERGEDERWRYRLPRTTSAHVRLEALNASTAHELRQVAHDLEREGARGVVLDLRGLYSVQMHAAFQVADLFLREGVRAGWSTRQRAHELRPGADASFDARQVVVLVDARTRAAAEWLACALQSAGARVLGEPTQGVAVRRSRVALEGWEHELDLITARLLDPLGEGALSAVRPDVPLGPGEDALLAARALLRSKRSL